MGGAGRSPEHGVPRRARALLFLYFVLGPSYLVVAGCATEQKPAAPAVDPLLGGVPLPPPPVAQAAAPPPPASGPAPLPAPSSATSPAALAPGAFQPLDPNHDLRIGGGSSPAPAASPASGTWRGQSAPADVALQRPEAAAEAPPAQRLQPQPVPAAQPVQPAPVFGLTASQVVTFEQAQASLRAHGVTWQRLETSADAGEWTFSCWIPSRQNPSTHQNYEARASDQIAALRAVLEQIERDQR